MEASVVPEWSVKTPQHEQLDRLYDIFPHATVSIERTDNKEYWALVRPDGEEGMGETPEEAVCNTIDVTLTDLRETK